MIKAAFDVISGARTWAIICGDSLRTLKMLPDGCVQCCVTSPPYFSLRDYGTGRWDGGDQACDHRQEAPRFNGPKQTTAQVSGHASKAEKNGRNDCHKCGARRIDEQLGLERTPEEYVVKMVEVFHEVRRVLRPDGSLWLNIGDSWNAYNGGRGKGKSTLDGRSNCGLPELPRGYGFSCKDMKNKDLIGIPWALAFALRADGWYLRSEIIWAKRSPMPESVTDRPTKAHEQVFLLSKSPRYFFDMVEASEPVSGGTHSRGRGINPKARGGRQHKSRHNEGFAVSIRDMVETRNMRSVWSLSSESFRGAHFATMPTELVRRCLVAGTSEKGCCAKCGAPRVRMVERERKPTRPGIDTKCLPKSDGDLATSKSMGWNRPQVIGNRDPQRHVSVVKTIGWKDGCSCGADYSPCLVLDPFGGAGTTVMVARRLGMRALGVELNPDYVRMAEDRIVADAPLLNAV